MRQDIPLAEMEANMNWIQEHAAEIAAGVCAVGWIFDNILAEIPAIAANSTFQVFKNIIDKLTVKMGAK